jgi:hypothetical protein
VKEDVKEDEAETEKEDIPDSPDVAKTQ